MQEKIPSSTPAQAQELPQYEQSLQEPVFNPENIEALKARARELAMQQAIAARVMQPKSNPTPPPQIAQPPQAPPRPQPIPRQAYQQPVPEPNVVYLRRNLTIAEVLLILALSTGILAGVQFAWGFSTDILSRIEIREK